MELYRSYSNKKKSGGSRRDDARRSFRNSRNDRRDSRDDRYSRGRRESAVVTCAECGAECEVPFVPKTDRPVYCSDCFKKNKPQSSEYEKYSRDDRRESRRDDRREPRSKSKSDRFLKKQESFFYNGSDKCYQT